ncbi:uncharacterized protein LOC126803856 [Argentina anserina]|uniref:uncharacterized protein LOC126803856 n=1 Tax=Argentina anserina TaxID=57926 RepID=UPI0021766862|nr:uncharacterized protein LOC126803856 [Potentilla anserina]
MQSTDELKKEIMYSSLELESVKCKVTESQQNVSNLLNLLEVAYQERDEARDQLNKIFEKVNLSSPEFPDINMHDSSTMGFVNVKQPNVERLLPVKGKLLQAVKEAGPLLMSLLIAGPPLPQWKNPPPPLQQPFKIPPIPLINSYAKGSPLSFDQRPFALSNPMNTSYFNETHTSLAANVILNFNTVLPSVGGSCFNNYSMMISNSGFDHQTSIAKRQRLQ